MARVSGVSFNDEECLKMTRKQFVKAHEDKFYLDRPVEERRIILDDAYSIMEGNKLNDLGAL